MAKEDKGGQKLAVGLSGFEGKASLAAAWTRVSPPVWVVPESRWPRAAWHTLKIIRTPYQHPPVAACPRHTQTQENISLWTRRSFATGHNQALSWLLSFKTTALQASAGDMH